MEYPVGRKVKVFDDFEALSHASAELIIDELKAAIAERSIATIALAGGETPKRLYEILSTEHRDNTIWKSTHFFLGDERCVPLSDPKSNFRMISEALLSPLNIPLAQIHHPNTVLASPTEIANVYASNIRSFFSGRSIGFDLVLLGMGADGHTASIFPETILSTNADQVVQATISPIAPRDRVTVTMQVINASHVALIQVSGNDKAFALSRVLELPASNESSLPASRVFARVGTYVYADRSALPEASVET